MLRERLLKNNGGSVFASGDCWELNPVWDPANRKAIGRTANHIIRETKSACEWNGFPEGAISVAQNGGGDHLILLETGDELKFWDHETGEIEPAQVVWD